MPAKGNEHAEYKIESNLGSASLPSDVFLRRKG